MRRGTGSRFAWVAALAVALAYLAVDSAVRLRTIRELEQSFGGPPATDPSSPTGYVRGEHGLVLPLVGMDGYNWIIQTQMMLAGAGLRIRHVDYDNPPAGRDVHWSGAFRWWLAGLAAADAAITGQSVALSVERVAPVANALLLAILLLALTPIVARRFGSLTAGSLALAMVAVKPYLDTFVVGNVDHHGLAATACFLSLLFLIAGGGGWVRSDGDPALDPPGRDLAAWLPAKRTARRWFLAAGIAGGAGLWISAATETPVLIGIGVGAVIATGVVGRRDQRGTSWRPVAGLWRLWGRAGAATSLLLYLLEYFPFHLGWRLEVNHPLFALAWLGGGELVAQACIRLRGDSPGGSQGLTEVAASAAAALALPVAIALAPERTFWVSDRFLWLLHEGYIREFSGFFTYWNSVTWLERLGNVSAMPLVCLAVTAIAWRRLPAPARATLAVGWPAGLFAVALALRQNRWWGMADAVWLAVFAGTMSVMLLLRPAAPTRRWRMATALCLLAVLVPAPALAASDWIRTRFQQDYEWEEVSQLVVRDVAGWLRQRVDGRRGVVVSDPNSTTLLVYFGGLEGVGSLYWENLPGLKTAAAIYGAPTEERARALIQEHGVTHLVVFSWNFFAPAYAMLSQGLPRGSSSADSGFVWRMFRSGNVPAWLREVRYPMPPDDQLRDQWVEVFEVRRDNDAGDGPARRAGRELR